MAFCSSCGEQNNDTSKFCRKCGAALKVTEVIEEQTEQSSINIPSFQSTAANAVDASNPTGTIQVTNDYVKWPSNTIFLSHLERVSTSTPSPSFPILAILILIIGFICFMLNLFVAIALIVIAVVWIGFWAYKKFNSPKGITFYMSSGNTTSIFLNDHAMVDSIVLSIQKALSNEEVEYSSVPSSVRTASGSATKGILG